MDLKTLAPRTAPGVEQQGERESSQGGQEERQHHPDDRVHGGVGEQPVGHDPGEVLEPDESVARVEAVPVGEAVVEGVEERPDDEDPEDRKRQGEQGGPPEDGVTVHRAAAARMLRVPGPGPGSGGRMAGLRDDGRGPAGPPPCSFRSCGGTPLPVYLPKTSLAPSSVSAR